MAKAKIKMSYTMQRKKDTVGTVVYETELDNGQTQSLYIRRFGTPFKDTTFGGGLEQYPKNLRVQIEEIPTK